MKLQKLFMIHIKIWTCLTYLLLPFFVFRLYRTQMYPWGWYGISMVGDAALQTALISQCLWTTKIISYKITCSLKNRDFAYSDSTTQATEHSQYWMLPGNTQAGYSGGNMQWNKFSTQKWQGFSILTTLYKQRS